MTLSSHQIGSYTNGPCCNCHCQLKWLLEFAKVWICVQISYGLYMLERSTIQTCNFTWGRRAGILTRAARMQDSCSTCVPIERWLGDEFLDLYKAREHEYTLTWRVWATLEPITRLRSNGCHSFFGWKKLWVSCLQSSSTICAPTCLTCQSSLNN